MTWNRLSRESPPIRNLFGPLCLRKYRRALMARSNMRCRVTSKCSSRAGTEANELSCGFLEEAMLMGGTTGLLCVMLGEDSAGLKVVEPVFRSVGEWLGGGCGAGEGGLAPGPASGGGRAW